MCEIKIEEIEEIELLDCYQWFPSFGLFLNYICGPSSHFYFENFQSRFSGHANLAWLKLHLTCSAFPLSTPAKKSPQNWRMCPATKIGMVMMLVLELWPSTIIAQWKRARFYNMPFMLHCGLQQ